MSQYYKHFESKGFEIRIVLMIFLVHHDQLNWLVYTSIIEIQPAY